MKEQSSRATGWTAGVTAIRMGDLDTMTLTSDPICIGNQKYVEVCQSGFTFLVNVEDLFAVDEIESVLGEPPGGGGRTRRYSIVKAWLFGMATGFLIASFF